MKKQVFGLTVGAFLLWSLPSLAIQGEYHWTLCGTSPAEAKQQLGAAVKKSSRRAVYYLDTADRALYRSGTVLRLRAEAGERVEVTAKVKTSPEKVPDPFHDEDGFKCEADFHGRQVGVNCSLSEEETSLDDLKAVLKGRQSAQTLFSKTQHAYLTALGVKAPWSSLQIVGPVDDLKWKLDSKAGKVDLEFLTHPSGGNLLELSTKEDPSSVARFQKLSGTLSSLGLRFCPKQTGIAAWALGLR
jgi:hypothetical protein